MKMMTWEEAKAAYEEKKGKITDMFIPAHSRVCLIDEFGELLYKVKASNFPIEHFEVKDVMSVEYEYQVGISEITITVQTIPAFKEEE